MVLSPQACAPLLLVTGLLQSSRRQALMAGPAPPMTSWHSVPSPVKVKGDMRPT